MPRFCNSLAGSVFSGVVTAEPQRRLAELLGLRGLSAFLPVGGSEEHKGWLCSSDPGNALGGIDSRRLHSVNTDRDVDRYSVRARGVARQEGRFADNLAVFTFSSDQRSGSLSVPITLPISGAEMACPKNPQLPSGISISKE